MAVPFEDATCGASPNGYRFIGLGSSRDLAEARLWPFTGKVPGAARPATITKPLAKRKDPFLPQRAWVYLDNRDIVAGGMPKAFNWPPFALGKVLWVMAFLH